MPHAGEEGQLLRMFGPFHWIGLELALFLGAVVVLLVIAKRVPKSTSEWYDENLIQLVYISRKLLLFLITIAVMLEAVGAYFMWQLAIDLQDLNLAIVAPPAVGTEMFVLDTSDRLTNRAEYNAAMGIHLAGLFLIVLWYGFRASPLPRSHAAGTM